MKYADRRAAGRRLADKLAHLKKEQPVVLALPRGGVAVGFEIAEALHAPLDIVLVRKIGVPWRPELALGAVTDGAAAEIFIDRDLATGLDIPDDYIKRETEQQLQEIERRRNSYCAGRSPVDIAGRTAVVVDDGIATGATMRVALRAARRRRPARLVLAVPVAPAETLATFRDEADEIICLQPQMALGAIGFYYRDFHQMTDAEVTDLLARASRPAGPPPPTLAVGQQRNAKRPRNERDCAAAPDWNAAVTLTEATFREAHNFLRRWGEVRRTGYFHVLTLTVDDPETFLAEIGKAIEESPGMLNFISHVIPAHRLFRRNSVSSPHSS